MRSLKQRAWQFKLNAPGMSALHRAGLVGLAASLCKLKEKGELPRKWEFELKDNRLTLPHLGTDAASIAELLQSIYAIDSNGLIDFPILWDSSQMLKAHVQQVLLGTFLQHPQSRKAEEKAQVMTLTIGEQPVEMQYLQLKDFKHREEKTAEEVSKAIVNGTNIKVAGWAFPGGMVRHNAFSNQTALVEIPEMYFLLLCAPLGCLYFHGRAFLPNGDYDTRTQFVVAIPRPASLSQHTRNLLDIYNIYDASLQKWLYVAGESDATLLSATMILLKQTALRLDIDFQELELGQVNFQVMRFGQVGWSRQQKTRTGVISTARLKRSMIEQYHVIHGYLTRNRTNEQGEVSVDVMPMKNRIAENIIWERPWYEGFADFLSHPRGKKIKYWRKELNELVKKIEWSDEDKRKFIDYIHDAMRIRYARVAENAKKGGDDVSSLLAREYDRMVLVFSKCRTKESFREELARFLAVTRPKMSHLSAKEQTDLVFKMAIQSDWNETKDLCLLAIATYSRREDEKDSLQIPEGNGNHEITYGRD